ncbi:hypothetical protein ABPG77_005249 [Micractinium sp. CCAP 211/92]
MLQAHEERQGLADGLARLKLSSSTKTVRRQVGFQPPQDSPSSVLRAGGEGGDATSPASTGRPEQATPLESPLAAGLLGTCVQAAGGRRTGGRGLLALSPRQRLHPRAPPHPRRLPARHAALRRERSAPQLPKLPKLKLGIKLGKGAGMARSKSHGNLRQASEATAVPAVTKSATSSPHAASSGGSEPVRIPFELSRRGAHRRAHSVDFVEPAADAGDAAAAGGGAEDGAGEPELSNSVISAASSLLGHHLGAAPTVGSSSAAGGSARSSPTAACAAAHRTHSAARDLYLAHADAVTAHAQVQSLQGALRREQEEVLRLREQLQLMTAERDRLLAELQLGSSQGGAAVFDMMEGQCLHPAHPWQQRKRQQQAAGREAAPRAAAPPALRLP